MEGSWLTNLLISGKVKTLLQQLSFELNWSDSLKKARILIICQLQRCELIDPDPQFRKIIDNPFQYPRNELIVLYDQLEIARNQTKRKHRQQHRMVKALGSPAYFDFFDKEHTLAGELALEVWMATVGSAIPKNGFTYGKKIWNMLSEARSSIPHVREKILELEIKAGECILGGISEDKLTEMCGYVPSAFRDQLNERNAEATREAKALLEEEKKAAYEKGYRHGQLDAKAGIWADED